MATAHGARRPLGGSLSTASRTPGRIAKVAIRDGKYIKINDHIYISPPWSIGAGEPYLIARVMEFVTSARTASGAPTSASSSSTSAAAGSSSSTIRVRANVFLRMRDISHRTSNDPRQLVATMHSEVFALENVRGLCEVRHRELIGDAPEVSAWKKREDHFYYSQLYDRYIHRFYDVLPTERIKNAPQEVLKVLRIRYSFIVAEIGMASDLCDALRGCAVCDSWAASTESVRCDTCKKFFHMQCLNPPLASKPAKGYSWTCAPCSKRHEQDVDLALSGGVGGAPLNLSDMARLPGNQGSIRGANASATAAARGGAQALTVAARGRGRGGGAASGGRRGAMASSDNGIFTPDGSPGIDKTVDDVRGTRCYNSWPYRYFGQHTAALDVLDPHDSIYPRATTRLGPKFQTPVVTWDEQLELGLGVPSEKKTDPQEAAAAEEVAHAHTAAKKPRGRPPKRKREGTDAAGTPASGTPTLPSVPLPAPEPEREVERGGDDSVEPIFIPGLYNDKLIEAYLRSVRAHYKHEDPGLVDMIDGALKLLMKHKGDAVAALTELSQTVRDFMSVWSWTNRAKRAFCDAYEEFNSDMKMLKKALPQKKPGEIVRFLYAWKGRDSDGSFWVSPAGKAMQANDDDLDHGDQDANGVRPNPASRAVSPSLSIFGEDDKEEARPPRAAATAAAAIVAPSSTTTTCVMCSTNSSDVWYKGPYSWTNRHLCVNCGLYWRKYAAENSHVGELVAVQTRRKDVSDDTSLGVAPPTKVAKLSKAGDLSKTSTPPPSAGAVSVTNAAAALTSAATSATPIPKPDAIKCVICRRIEPKRKLAQCRQCSLSVHQGCYGLTDDEVKADFWQCEACTNERTLDAALVPRCILCPPPLLPALTTPSVPPTSASSSASAGDKGASAHASAAASRGRKSETNGFSVVVPSGPPLGPLDAVKPTECNNWTHLLCAVFMPDVVFTDTERLRLVEGAGNLPWHRYSATCDICHDDAGACIGCAEPSCKRTFHVSCAWLQQPSFTFGFEITPVKGSRRDVVPTTSFKTESGAMSALVFCKDHREAAKTKKLYEVGEVDSSIGLTALQTYARTFKGAVPSITKAQAEGDGTYALLRRAKRLDNILAPSTLGALTSASPELVSSANGFPSATSTSTSTTTTATAQYRSRPSGGSMSGGRAGSLLLKPDMTGVGVTSSKSCVRCGTHFSPFWWDAPPGAKRDATASSSRLGVGVGVGVHRNGRGASAGDAVDVDLDGDGDVEGEADGGHKGNRVVCNMCKHALDPPNKGESAA